MDVLHIKMTALQSETFLVRFRVACEIQPENYAPDTHRSFSDTSLSYIYCKPVHTMLFGMQLCMITYLMYLMTLLHTK